MQVPIEWLLGGPPWVRYRTRIDLLEQPQSDKEVLVERGEMLSHHLVQGLLAELQNWPEPVLRSHKDAKHPLHKLTFIADLGLQAGDPDVDEVIKRVLAHRSSEGPFMVLVNYPKHFGGSGEDQMVWALCNAPLVLYALVMFGFGEDSRVQEGVHHLLGLVRENGWPCA